MDYTYWSTPVIKLIDVSPNTRLDKFYSFNAGLDSWLNEDANAVMTLGKGYIIRGPESFRFQLLPFTKRYLPEFE
jgi:hypothetical protein